jgi:hypothetical protein
VDIPQHFLLRLKATAPLKNLLLFSFSRSRAAEREREMSKTMRGRLLWHFQPTRPVANKYSLNFQTKAHSSTQLFARIKRLLKELKEKRTLTTQK